MRILIEEKSIRQRIVSLFNDMEEQREVAGVFNTKLQEITTKQDREKAFHDILVALKRNSYEYFSSQLGADVNALKRAIEGKKALEELEKRIFHWIKANNGNI